MDLLYVLHTFTVYEILRAWWIYRCGRG